MSKLKRNNPIGESRNNEQGVNFDKKLELEFHGTKVTSDVGLLAYRELDEAFGSTTMIEPDFYDNRKGKNTQHHIIALLRQSIYMQKQILEEMRDIKNHVFLPIFNKLPRKRKSLQFKVIFIRLSTPTGANYAF